MSFPSDLRRGRLMAHIQQRFEGFVGSAPVERGGDPVFLAHVIGGEETGRAAKRDDEVGVAFQVDDIHPRVRRQAKPARGWISST